MRRRARGLLVLGTVAALAAVVAFLVHGWLVGPLYRPGMVRRGLGLRDPLTPPPKDAGGTSYRVATDVHLFRFEVGTGEPVVVLHGGPCVPAARPWSGILPLTGRHRFVFYDQRGCGRSTRPLERLTGAGFHDKVKELDRTLGLAAQIGDVERVRRILGVERLVLVGHSFGALLAALYAAEFPERVRALVLVAPANLVVFPSERDDLYATVGRLLTGEAAAEYDAFTRELCDLERNLERSDVELAALYRRFGDFYSRAAGLPVQDDEPAVPNGGLMPLAVFLSMGRRHDYAAALAAVEAPVLVVHGGRDLQPEASSRAFAGYFPNARTVVIPAAGHFVAEDEPAAFAAAVGAHLAELTAVENR